MLPGQTQATRPTVMALQGEGRAVCRTMIALLMQDHSNMEYDTPLAMTAMWRRGSGASLLVQTTPSCSHPNA